MSEDHIYEFKVTMSCSHCSDLVKDKLKTLNGVKSYETDLTDKPGHLTVITEPDISYRKVLETVALSKKKISKGWADGEVMSVELPAKEDGVLGSVTG